MRIEIAERWTEKKQGKGKGGVCIVANKEEDGWESASGGM